MRIWGFSVEESKSSFSVEGHRPFDQKNQIYYFLHPLKYIVICNPVLQSLELQHSRPKKAFQNIFYKGQAAIQYSDLFLDHSSVYTLY